MFKKAHIWGAFYGIALGVTQAETIQIPVEIHNYAGENTRVYGTPANLYVLGKGLNAVWITCDSTDQNLRDENGDIICGISSIQDYALSVQIDAVDMGTNTGVVVGIPAQPIPITEFRGVKSPDVTSASWGDFWTGFSLVFCAGLVGVAARWVRKCIGVGSIEEN